MNLNAIFIPFFLIVSLSSIEEQGYEARYFQLTYCIRLPYTKMLAKTYAEQKTFFPFAKAQIIGFFGETVVENWKQDNATDKRYHPLSLLAERRDGHPPPLPVLVRTLPG